MAVPMPPGARPRPLPPKKGSLGKITSIEDQVRSSFYTPSPLYYRPKAPGDLVEPKKGGKISESRIPSGHDYNAKNKSWVPGPGSYQTPDMKDFALPDGGRVNRVPPKVKQAVVDEYPTPPPGAYGIPNDPTGPRQVNGKFSKDPRVTAFIQEAVRNSKGNPGPGAHDVLEAMDNAKPFCSSGGKTLHIGKGKNYFEMASMRTEGLPAPDRYDLPCAIKADKCIGRAVFKYKSATIGDTNAMVTRLCSGDPGPGTYETQDCPPSVQPVTMRGRELGHAMPAPYNYHCAPDLARKYDNLAPVRSKNSGDQIYGNGVKIKRSENPRFRGNPNRDSRPSSAGSTSFPKEKVHSTQMPTDREFDFAATAEMDMNPEDAVQWRSGGFAMRKSNSTPTMRANPAAMASHEEVKKTYPDLHKRDKGQPITESVCTRENADEFHKIQRGKVKLGALSHNIHSASSSVLVPLDLEKMKREAANVLLDKARSRLNAEGFNKDQLELVINEMKDVMGQKVGLDLSPAPLCEAAEPGTEGDEPAYPH